MSGYDVVVAGASFAGLAVAQRLEGRVLVVDPKPVGTGQTSACGAPVALVQALGAQRSIQQVHHQLVVHTGRAEYVWPLDGEPFCTFDYRLFCEAAWERVQGEFWLAAVRGYHDGVVDTTAGPVRAAAVVDCTGWRASVARGVSPAGSHERWFGLETEIPARFEPGLHFYFWREVAQDGYAWAFPCGDRVRFGVLSYRGRTGLRDSLDRFVARFGLRPRGYHGGFLGVGVRPSGWGRVLVVGDAAGHCLPLTGEGIRSAIHAGWLAASLLNAALKGQVPWEVAHGTYRGYIAAQRRRLKFLAAATGLTLRLPAAGLDAVVWLFSRPRLRSAFLRHYLATFPAPSTPG